MHPVLYVNAWPVAQETVMPREHLNLGWVSGAHDAHISQVLDALVRMHLGEWQLVLLCGEEALPKDVDPRVSWCDLRGPEAGKAIATLDAMILPSAGLVYWRELLEKWAIPPIVLSELAGGGSLALTLKPDDIEAIAINAVRMLTDPPFRRQSLGRLRGTSVKAKPHGYWRVEGVFDSSYSLALVNRQLAMAMSKDANKAVALLTYEQGSPASISVANLSPEDQRAVGELWAASDTIEGAPDAAFRNAWPPVVRGMRGRLRVLANYHWEETRFPREYAVKFNQTLDLITVGSSQTARFLEDAGVNVPMAVVGDGTDHCQIKQAGVPPHSLPDGFRFLHVSSCFPRKALDIILAAFGEAFAGDADVALVIKTFPNPHNEVEQQVARFREAYPSGPMLSVFQDDWSAAEMAGLYRDCHAYVAPSRGEGFGLPLAEAMMHRLPVITTDWGGHLDFCSADNSWLIPSRLTMATTHLTLPGSLWAEPDQSALADTMRIVREAMARGSKSRHARALELKNKLNRAEETVASLTWDVVAAKTQRAIDHLVRVPLPQPTRLGWVSSWGVRCGVASYSDYMTTAMQPQGALSKECALHVFAPLHDTPADQDPAFVHRCWVRGAVKPHQALIREVIKRELEAVVIQYHWSFFSASVLVDTIRALYGAGVAVFLDMHNTGSAPEGIAENYNLIHGLSRCTRILVHSLRDVNRLESWGLRDNLTLLPLATYPVPLPTHERLTALKKEFALKGKRVLGSYGFLMPHKGVLELVEAMPRVLDAEPNAHLMLVNAAYSEAASDALKQQIEATIERLGIEEHVTFISDYLDDADSLALLKLAEVVVFPYQYSEESSSAAVRMAISGRCPVAITPLKIFDDVASGCTRLPGVAPDEIAQGLIDILKVSSEAGWQAEQARALEALGSEMDAGELSARLLGMVQGHLRRLEV